MFTIENSAFAAALDTLALAIETRQPIPILDNVAIAAAPAEGAVCFTATDLDMAIDVTAAAEIASAISTTLPAAMLRKIAKAADKAALVTVTDLGNRDGDATIDADGATYRLTTLPIGDFPKLKDMDPGKVWRFDLDADILHNAIDATRTAISTEETRYYLNGIFLHVHAGELVATATDGHRMHVQSFGVVDGTADMPGVIIPTKAVKILHKLLGGRNAPKSVRVTVAPNRVDFEYGGSAFTVAVRTRTVDGTFPDYRRVCPEAGNVAEVDGAAMIKAIAKVSLVSDDKAPPVALEFGANGCTLSVAGDNGAASARIDCSWPHAALRIGFNSRYLTETLAIAGDGVALDLTDSGNPIRVTSDRVGWFAVIMPYRLRRCRGRSSSC